MALTGINKTGSYVLQKEYSRDAVASYSTTETVGFRPKKPMAESLLT